MVIGWLVIGFFSNFCTFCYFCYSCYFAITYNFVYRNDLNRFLKQDSTTFLICFEQTLHCAACHALSTKWVKFVFLRSPLVLFFTYCPEQLHWGLADTVTYLKLWIFAWIGTIFFECKDFFFQQRTSKLQCEYTNDETSGLDAPGIFLLQLLQVARMSCFPTSQAIVVGGGLGGAVWTGWTCGGHRETSWNHRCFLRWKVCQQPTLSLRTVAELFCWLLGSKVTWESKWQRSLLT